MLSPDCTNVQYPAPQRAMHVQYNSVITKTVEVINMFLAINTYQYIVFNDKSVTTLQHFATYLAYRHLLCDWNSKQIAR